MIGPHAELEFTGEFLIPGKTDARIEADHFARYRFAAQYARNRSVLDIACGAGYSAPMFLEAGAARYDGVDLDPRVIEHAARTYGNDRVHYYVGDISTYTTVHPYQLITCFETIEHVANYRSALRNLFSLLVNDGVLIISTPNRPITSPNASRLTDAPANTFHLQEFTPKELAEELTAAGFSVDPKELYGQRQRYVFASARWNRIMSKLTGPPDSSASPAVTLVRSKTPRYFIFCARKPIPAFEPPDQ